MFTERFYTIYQAIERAVIFETVAIEITIRIIYKYKETTFSFFRRNRRGMADHEKTLRICVIDQLVIQNK